MRIDDGGGKPHNAEYDYQAFGSAFKDGGVFDRGEIHFAKEVHQPSTEHHDHDDEVPAAERVTNLIFKEQQKNNDRYAAQKDKHG